MACKVLSTWFGFFLRQKKRERDLAVGGEGGERKKGKVEEEICVDLCVLGVQKK